MSDIVLSVPTKIRWAPDYDPYRPVTRGVFIHTTRGGTASLQQDYQATVNYFASAAAKGDCAHLVIGPSEVTRCVPDGAIAGHALENNKTHLGIEIAQPRINTPLVDFQYRAAAEAVAKWAEVYKFPLVRVFSQYQNGIIGHEDSEQGKRGGKSDPGPKFDWGYFLFLLPKGAPRAEEYNIGPGFTQFLRDHPEWGDPRQDTWYDGWGNGYLWTTATSRHPQGSLLVWRKYTNTIRPVAWE